MALRGKTNADAFQPTSRFGIVRCGFTWHLGKLLVAGQQEAQVRFFRVRERTEVDYLRSWLASCAAMITIISLAFETFTQQLLLIRPFPISEGPLRSCSIQRANALRELYRALKCDGL